MFYSHEVLSSRKYGVATVWLVATLGSKTSLKKVSRKAILDVNITKTCETIAEPSVPMALRLQSSLLYGVTSVYSQQCGYVLADVESVRNDMRALAKALRTSAPTLSQDTKGRPEHLMLHDDPNFLPELDCTFADLNLLDDSHLSQITAGTSFLSSTQLPSSHLRYSTVNLDIPSLRSLSIARSLPGGHVAHDVSSTLQVHPVEHRRLQDDLDLDFQDDLNLSLADNLDFHLHNELRARSTSRDPNIQDELVNSELLSVYATPGRMVCEKDGEPGTGRSHSRSRTQPHRQQEAQVLDLATTSSTASAPLQRKEPGKKVLQLDATTQVRAHELKEWSTNYLQIMDQQHKHKATSLLRGLAKENAMFWYHGYAREDDPLADFQNAAVLRRKQCMKRSGEDMESGERRVKSRQSSIQQSHDAHMVDDTLWEDPMMSEYDDIELGRAQHTPLQDRHSTLLPWSYSNEHSGGQVSNMGSRFSSLPPRTSQPLFSPSLVRHIPHEGGSSDAGFEAFGPAGLVDTQTAAESQWLRSTFEDESINFLRFLKDAIEKCHCSSIGFAQLLPPSDHTAIVAAQGFLHVLSLGTRGMLSAAQIEPQDVIELRLAA